MSDVVHSDEKWLTIYIGAMQYYMAPTEEFPLHNSHNKRYIEKKMFLAAVARRDMASADAHILTVKLVYDWWLSAFRRSAPLSIDWSVVVRPIRR